LAGRWTEGAGENIREMTDRSGIYKLIVATFEAEAKEEEKQSPIKYA
jgi:hypothetical protein